MEHKYTLTKPFTLRQRTDFIIKYGNHEGLAITEDKLGLYADDPIMPEENTEEYNDRMRQLRAEAYSISVDNLMSEYIRKETFNGFDDGEQAELSAKIKDIVDQIQTEYRYK